MLYLYNFLYVFKLYDCHVLRFVIYMLLFNTNVNLYAYTKEKSLKKISKINAGEKINSSMYVDDPVTWSIFRY